MIQVRDIRVRESVGADMGYSLARAKALKLLRISERDITKVRILHRSLDARKKPELFWVYTLGISLRSGEQEYKLLKLNRDPAVSSCKPIKYEFPKVLRPPMKGQLPVIVGFGPAGMFAAYFMAMAGCRPIVLEQGYSVEERSLDVRRFFEGSAVKPYSNVQFGEGGAGTFSDGKLNTGNQDKDGIYAEILKILVQHGAPEEILYDGRPHLGTDVLHRVVRSIREDIINHKGEIRFHSKLTGIAPVMAPDKRSVRGYKLKILDTETGEDVFLDASCVLLGIGNAARDTYRMLQSLGFQMEKKPFAVGFRVEHPQKLIDISQYGKERGELEAASYKLTGRSASGRGIYSFCMCPGGYVINASSEVNGIVVNGMSYSGREGNNANSAIVLAVTPGDIPGEDPLAGMEWQRQLEQKAFQLGEGKIPYCSLLEFKERRLMTDAELSAALAGMKDGRGDIQPAYPAHKGNHKKAPVWELFSESFCKEFLEGMKDFGKKIKGFDAPDTVLSAVESRTSSPVRILRNQDSLEALGRPGIYPMGEGAGYAGGILSSAADGIRCAAMAAKRFR